MNENQIETKKDLSFLAEGWRSLLLDEFSKPYIEDLRQLLRSETNQGFEYYPPKEKIFRAFKLVDYSQTKVVIIGQDPYHGKGQANGLAFAVEKGVTLPPSLNNIFKEIQSDTGKRPTESDLENWANQGVLLLNTVLTVRANQAFSHREKGWEVFTDRVISLLNEKNSPIIFVLWGSAAQAKEKMITNKIHKILKSAHPSPLSAHRGFFGCKHFSTVNEILRSLGQNEINWTT
ncbi:uracil-DNA glycosylase [Pigmentibacter sp. JX0631]|nr:uracil-DNA glycosylase [Pigmentibacter sp. JX0631]WGL58973.1 uracil-DNA glycosylase [Pigmentibacter sp. JX0631]